ncbi:MAG: AMP-binding protein [Gemmatimonadota bacterium]
MKSADFLAEAATRWPTHPALSDASRSWSFAELDGWVSDIARRIRAEDAPGDGDVLALVVESTPEGVAALFAGVRAGVTVAPLNPMLTEGERDDALRALTGIRPGGFVVLWTSGTAGSPRGVVLTADNLRASTAGAAERLSLGPGDRWLASLSVAHVGGLALVVRCVILGCELVAPGAFDVAVASDLIDDRRITHVSLVPTQMARLLDHRQDAPPPPSLRCVLLGGAHAPGDLTKRALAAGWPLALTYGMTEMSSQVATADTDLVRRKPGTVGPPLPGVDVRITSSGEVVTRGPTLAAGRVGARGALVDEEGWYRTGDLGRLDEEGHLWIVGRRSSRIITGGVTVDPEEVEEALRAHPAVVDACVVGLEDPEWGERVVAALVPVEGEFDLEDVDRHARERLAPPKRPRRWLPLDALPLGANGKVDRAAVKRCFDDRAVGRLQ